MKTDNYKAEYRDLINEYGHLVVEYAIEKLGLTDVEEIKNFCVANEKAAQRAMEEKLKGFDTSKLRQGFLRRTR